MRAISEYGHSWRIKNTRIFLELAEAPLALPNQKLFGTFRRSAWRGAAIEYNGDPSCCAESGANCSYINNLLSWTHHGRCPNGSCMMRTEEAFLIQAQKLVDTLLVSDAIVSKELGYSYVLAISMDDDIIPGLLTVTALGGSATVIRFGKQTVGYYDEIMMRNGISVIDYPALG